MKDVDDAMQMGLFAFVKHLSIPHESAGWYGERIDF